MESSREIISVQVGGFSNWVGAHRWNMIATNKEADENDREEAELFSSKCGTVKPRVAIFDLRSRRGGLFMPDTVDTSLPSWDSSVDQFCTELHPKLNLNWDESPVFDLSDSQMVWSDFLEPTVDEMSFKEVPFWDARNGNFSSYSSGDFQHPDCELSQDFREECFDMIRTLLEDCDQPQGCECTFDNQGGFAGLANSLAAEFRDQCRSAALSCTMFLDSPTLPTDPILSEDVFHTKTGHSNSEDVNCAVAVHSMLEHANVLVPLSASTEVTLGSESNVLGLLKHSAYLATFLETMTLPFRRSCGPRSRKLLMTDWCSVLSPRRDLRVIASEISIADMNRPILNPLSPCSSLGEITRWSRLLVGRGVGQSSIWPSEVRAERFEFNAVRLPHTYPLDIFPMPEETYAGRTGHMMVSAGAASSLYPWLTSLSSPLRSRSAGKETARRYGHLSEEDATAMAEELATQADAYNPSS